MTDDDDKTEDRTIFKLNSLNAEIESRYLLHIYQAGPFSMGKNTFLVDTLDRKEGALYGSKLDGTTVVQFPDTFSYMLVNRNQYEIISETQARQEMEEEIQAHRTHMSAMGEPEPQEHEAPPHSVRAYL